MHRQLGLLFLLMVSTTFAQSKKIIADFCQCNPLTHSISDKTNKLYFIEEDDKSEEYTFELHLKTITKEQEHWELTADQIIDLSTITLSDEDLRTSYKDYFDTVFPAKRQSDMQSLHLQGKDYLLSVLELGKMGTAYNGLHEYLFVFQNSQEDTPPRIYYYQQSEYEKEFTLRNADRNSNPKDPFYQFSLNYVKKHFQSEEPSYHIEEEEVFLWRDQNPRLFSNLYQEKSSAIHFTKHDSYSFYNDYKKYFGDCELKNERYEAYSGVKTPVFVYDKKKDQSLLILIPDGWPNGGAWGVRSYNLINLKGHNLYLDSNGSLVIVDLEKGTIRSKDKES